MRSAILTLTLTDFRSYEQAALDTGGRSVFLFGPNGAGKTNLLEAISFLSPGRGMRGSSVAEVGRRLPGEANGRAWAVAAVAREDEETVRVGTGLETGASPRRLVRIEGETVPPGRLSDHLRPVWLTPAQDRLFLEGAGERRRFFDRLVFAAEPEHAAHATAYERALRERGRLLLAQEAADLAWLTALEARLAHSGARMAQARARTLEALREQIDGRGGRPFPQATLDLTGDFERMALAGDDIADIEQRLAAGALAQCQ